MTIGIQLAKNLNASIGCSSHFSFLPYLQELKRFDGQFELVRGDSLELRQMLEERKIGVALCSTINLFRQPQFEMCFPMGLVSRGGSGLFSWGCHADAGDIHTLLQPRLNALRTLFGAHNVQKSPVIKPVIKSIFEELDSLPKVPLAALPVIKTVAPSPSGEPLSKIMYFLLFGQDAFDANERNQKAGASSSDQMTFDLHGGDETLIKKSRYHAMIDLAELWYYITGLPFVSSVWQKLQSEKRSFHSLKHFLDEAAEKAQVRMKVDPMVYTPRLPPVTSQGHAVDLSSCWRGIQYRIGPQEMRGLMVFLVLACRLEKRLAENEVFDIKLLRWHQREKEFADSAIMNRT
ncbi:MAG: hypothetical protein CMP10_10960 [Zetaproteobacteria bacterium]|nr:hypothetical protein [Pseudobdellovibrionaceae bacterium]